MNHLCPTKSNCVPGSQFLGEDTPFANISAELPDVDTFLGCNFGWDQNVLRLGWCAINLTDVGCCRAGTQQQADICAANTQLSNQISTWSAQCLPPPPPPPIGGCPPNCGNPGGGGGPGTGGGPTHPVGPAPQIFTNQQVSCPFTCPDGLVFTWTIPPGVFVAMDQATANAEAQSFACQQALRFYICLSNLNSNACVGRVYSSTVFFTGGTAPISANITSGSLPPGLVMTQATDGKSFTISGTPTTAGIYPLTIMAVDSLGNFMNKSYMINVLGITNISAVPPAMEMRAYSFQLNAAGGTGPFAFTQTSGNIPGISINSSGLMSGTPNYVTAGSYPFGVTVTDATGNSCNQTGTLVITLAPGPDWTKLVWNQYQLNLGVPSIPPNVVMGQGIANTASGFIAYVNGLGPPFPSITPVSASGVNYTGPQVTSRIILTLSVSGSAGNSLSAQVFRNGVAINNAGYAQSFGSGTFTFDFVVVASVGAALTVTDNSPGNSWGILNQIGNSGILSWTWAIVNV